MNNYLKSIRAKNWLKNLLVFPLKYSIISNISAYENARKETKRIDHLHLAG